MSCKSSVKVGLSKTSMNEKIAIARSGGRGESEVCPGWGDER